MVNKKLDKKTAQDIKKALLEKKESLENELSQFATANKHNNEDFNAQFPDFGDKEDENSAEVATYSDNLSLEHTLKKSLRDVIAALKSVDEGSYGICKYCNEVINIERLKARPASSSCMACKTKLKGR